MRYTLLKETLGKQDFFPTPSHFGTFNYEVGEAWNLPKTPTIFVANPPFAEDGNEQRAAKFIDLMMSRMRTGDQFSFVLPQTLLTGPTHGASAIRQKLARECHILEVWQMPKGLYRSIGTTTHSYNERYSW